MRLGHACFGNALAPQWDIDTTKSAGCLLAFIMHGNVVLAAAVTAVMLHLGTNEQSMVSARTIRLKRIEVGGGGAVNSRNVPPRNTVL